MFGSLYFGQPYLGQAAGVTATTIVFSLPDVIDTTTRPAIRLKSTVPAIARKTTRLVTKDKTTLKP